MQGWQGVGRALGVGVLCRRGRDISLLSEGVGMGLGGAAKCVTGTSGIEALAVHRCGQIMTPRITRMIKAPRSLASRELILTPG